MPAGCCADANGQLWRMQGEERVGQVTDHYAECLYLLRHGFRGIVISAACG